MASLEHDTLADLATTVAEVRNEEQTAETKEAGGSVATDGVNSGCDKPVVPSLGPTGPALSQTPATTGVANGAAASAHPKKFSAVNINKKFLEKTGSSTPSAPPTGHAVAKSGNSSREH